MLLHADTHTSCGYVLVDDFWDASVRRLQTEMCGTKHKWWVTGPDSEFELKCCGHGGDADCHINCRQGNYSFDSGAANWSTKMTVHELRVLPLELTKILAEDDADVRRVLGWQGNSRIGHKWVYTKRLIGKPTVATARDGNTGWFWG